MTKIQQEKIKFKIPVQKDTFRNRKQHSSKSQNITREIKKVGEMDEASL
jgi:hypothetical protein